ncbi:MAG: type VI secretion system baseplate subunit TssK [Gammaproteobacteria bacterium]
MSWNNRIVWSEGMFLRPQHFQQHLRYVEGLVEGRCGVLRTGSWGFTELEIDKQLLTLGKLALTSARGVFPDGTPFNVPGDDDGPPVLEIPENIHDTVVYLALPVRRAGLPEVRSDGAGDGMTRYRSRDYEVRDSNTGTDSVAEIRVATPDMRFVLESEGLDGYAAMGVVKIVESRSDRHVIVDDRFMPSALDCRAAPALAGFIRELQGLLHHRGESIASRVSGSGRGGAAEIADFLLLQAVNRYEPLITHLSNSEGVHPEDFYRLAVQIAGELATFTAASKRAPEFPGYRHDNLQGTFDPLVSALRQSLSMVLEQTATAIPLQERRYGIRVAPISDRGLLGSASFVLAVSAKMPDEELRRNFPTQVKIGSVEQIRELVNLQLPGIRVRPLPAAPRQIPYHAGFAYFELDRQSEYWTQLDKSGGFAIHIGGDFPDIELEFWAIKG